MSRDQRAFSYDGASVSVEKGIAFSRSDYYTSQSPPREVECKPFEPSSSTIGGPSRGPPARRIPPSCAFLGWAAGLSSALGSSVPVTALWSLCADWFAGPVGRNGGGSGPRRGRWCQLRGRFRDDGRERGPRRRPPLSLSGTAGPDGDCEPRRTSYDTRGVAGYEGSSECERYV